MEGTLTTNNIEDPKKTETENEEEELVIYEEGDIVESVQKCKHSIVGRLITDKAINPSWVHNDMYNIWRRPAGFQMKEIQEKLYQFFFEKEGDMKRVLKGSPWMFRNSWLLMEKWERSKSPKEMEFTKAEARVKINVERPINRGTNMGSKEDGITWVDFKYEKLPTFCYHCGIIGHDENCRPEAEENEEGNQQNSKELGAWIRADVIGIKVSGRGVRREEEEIEKGNRGKHNEALKEAQKKLLSKLEALAVTEDNQPNHTIHKNQTTPESTRKEDKEEASVEKSGKKSSKEENKNTEQRGTKKRQSEGRNHTKQQGGRKGSWENRTRTRGAQEVEEERKRGR
ncbi:hypothetical protein PIB30_008921 [Stylosanthes scabra]|uniref:DUF4283 domain-containing protein n=1 Tax=Stylosanthes scabra TaxID=79078 RepID=A0ABU6R640_9FABA|nr:hypothetical protein [Stylosanthes scabra]